MSYKPIMKILGTIKAKLLLSFAVFLVITLAIISTTLWFDWKKERINQILTMFHQINTNIQTIGRLESDFFADETILVSFYTTGDSRYLRERKVASQDAKNKLYKLGRLSESKAFSLSSAIDSLLTQIEKYESISDKLVELVKFRGFKDYGLEGQMREHIHTIENANKIALLMIRRHEKDFIIRKEKIYVEKLKKGIDLLNADILSKNQPNAMRVEMLRLLDNYKKSFMQLANLEIKIGYNNQSGTRGELHLVLQNVRNTLDRLDSIVVKETDTMRTQINTSLVSIIFVAVALMIASSILITQILSKPIRKLSTSIHEVIDHKFSKEIPFQVIKNRDEIGKLSRDFGYMLQTVQKNITEIEEKTQLLEREQISINDSLKYAKQIQQAILPEDEDMRKHLNDYFVIYEPKDIVSGDFYWFAEKDNQVFLAVVDCTGHGVPGAFMSMIGNTLLSKIIHENEFFTPAFILEILHQEVIAALNQEKRGNDDGMDLSLLIFENGDNDTKKLQFAGAKRPLLYSKNKEIKEIAGTRRSIGGANKEASQEKTCQLQVFENHNFELQKGDRVYLFSDGITDQPNELRKKFGMKRLVEVLQESITFDLSTQKNHIWKEVTAYTGSDTKQRDDIAFLAIQF